MTNFEFLFKPVNIKLGCFGQYVKSNLSYILSFLNLRESNTLVILILFNIS